MSYRDADVLYEMYHERGMSTYEIADELGCGQTTVRRWMDRHDIDTRRANNDKHGHHRFNSNYETFHVSIDGNDEKVYIHRLAAVAWHGLDAVVGKEVHHKSGHGLDNREGNFEFLTKEEHARLHQNI